MSGDEGQQILGDKLKEEEKKRGEIQTLEPQIKGLEERKTK